MQILNYHPHVTCIPCCTLAVWREAAAFETHTFEADINTGERQALERESVRSKADDSRNSG